MRNSQGVLLAALVLALMITPMTKVLWDTIASLQQELQTYQTTGLQAVPQVSHLTPPAEPETLFDDVSLDAWYNQYITAAADRGIVAGYYHADGTRTGMFGPQNPVTVAEALKMIFVAAQVDTSSCGAQEPQHPGTQSHWAAPFIACAEQKHVRLFDRNAAIDPNRSITRAEALSVIDDVFGEVVPDLTSEFSDAKGHEYEADIAFGVQRGIVLGDANGSGVLLGTFRPDASINRAELSKLLYEQLK